MASPLKNISPSAKGFILIILGTILTLYAFGFLQAQLNLILVIVGVGMVIYGIKALNAHKKIMRLIEEASRRKKR